MKSYECSSMFSPLTQKTPALKYSFRNFIYKYKIREQKEKFLFNLFEVQEELNISNMKKKDNS